MITFKEFLEENRKTNSINEDFLSEKSTEELLDTFVNRHDLTLNENKSLAGGLYLRYRNQIFREKDINKKFRLMIDAIAFSSVLTVAEIKKIFKEDKGK